MEMPPGIEKDPLTGVGTGWDNLKVRLSKNHPLHAEVEGQGCHEQQYNPAASDFISAKHENGFHIIHWLTLPRQGRPSRKVARRKDYRIADLMVWIHFSCQVPIRGTDGS